MTPQELKNSILQLAIQGKLVEQRPEEGTAAELLEKILATKNTKGAKGNLTRRRGGAENMSGGSRSRATGSRAAHRASSVPSVPVVPTIPDDEKPFDIPESWEWVRLESIINSVPSKQFQILESEVRQSGMFAVISQSKEYSIGFTDKSEKVYHHASPVIVFGDHTAEVKYVEFDFVVGADGVKIFEPLDGIVIAKFLFYVLQFHSCDLSKIGGYSRHYKFLKDKLIPLPPLAEQKRIVAKIEELLPLIDRYEKAWSKLEDFNKRFPVDMQKSVLQMAIQGKLVEQRPEEGTGEELYRQIQAEKQRLVKSGKIKKEKPLPEITDDEIPFDIPDSWKWVRFGDLGSLKSGYAFKSAEYTKHGIQVVRISDLGDDSIGLKDAVFYPRKAELTQYLVVDGSFLICMTGSIGKMAWVKDGILRYLNQRVGMFVPDALCSLEYLWHFLHTSYVIDGWIRAKTSTNGNIKNSDITELMIPLPPLAEQKRIVAKLEEILPLCERLR